MWRRCFWLLPELGTLQVWTCSAFRNKKRILHQWWKWDYLQIRQSLRFSDLCSRCRSPSSRFQVSYRQWLVGFLLLLKLLRCFFQLHTGAHCRVKIMWNCQLIESSLHSLDSSLKSSLSILTRSELNSQEHLAKYSSHPNRTPFLSLPEPHWSCILQLSVKLGTSGLKWKWEKDSCPNCRGLKQIFALTLGSHLKKFHSLHHIPMTKRRLSLSAPVNAGILLPAA